MSKIEIRTAYSPTRDPAAMDFSGDDGRSLTKQSHADECDVNNIIRSFAEADRLDELFVPPERWASGDATGIPDYQEARNIVIMAEQQFGLLPADLRERFNNDPQKFLAFYEDDRNLDEIVKLGLKKAPEPLEAPLAPTEPKKQETASGGS